MLAVGWKSLAQAKHSEHPLIVQPIGGATDGKQLWFKPADDKGWLEIPFRVEKDITADLVVPLIAFVGLRHLPRAAGRQRGR